MSNLQIKGIDGTILNQQFETLAADENRSVSQQILFLIRTHLARKRRTYESATGGSDNAALTGSRGIPAATDRQ